MSLSVPALKLKKKQNIISFVLVGYEMLIAKEERISTISYPTRASGIIVKYSGQCPAGGSRLIIKRPLTSENSGA